MPVLRGEGVVRFVPFDEGRNVYRVQKISNRTCGAIGTIYRIRLWQLCLFLLVFINVPFFLLNVLFIFLPNFFLLHLLHFLRWDNFFLIRRGAIMYFDVGRRSVDVIFNSPATITTVPHAIANPGRNFSARCPFNVTVIMSTLNRIRRFALTVNVRRRGVFIIPSACASVIQGGPFTIQAPLGPLIAIQVEMLVLTVRGNARVLYLRVSSASNTTIFRGNGLFAIETMLKLREDNVQICRTFFLRHYNVNGRLFVLARGHQDMGLPGPTALKDVGRYPPVKNGICNAFLAEDVHCLLHDLVFR